MKIQTKIILSGIGIGIASQLFINECRAQSLQKPNIIFLLTDDQGYKDLGCLGNEIIKTPNIDELGYNGTIFTNAYVTTSICVVSRASILTGQYARRHGIYDFVTSFTDRQWQNTYPMLLQRNGYKTGFVGKLGVHEWTRDSYPMNDFDAWYGVYVGQGEYDMYDDNGKPIHSTKRFGQQAIRFINNYKDEPFCLSISFKANHGPMKIDPEYADLYKDAVIPLPETMDDKYFKLLPPFFQEKKNYARQGVLRAQKSPGGKQENLRDAYRLITGVDVIVGKIMDELRKHGIAENTVIIYMGDNGHLQGEHGISGKWYAYEPSIRIPLIVYDPRLPKSKKGQHIEKQALNIDIAPTILSYAGIEIPGLMQGESLAKLIENNDKPWRTHFYYEQHYDRSVATDGEVIFPVEGVVTDNYKYVFYFEENYEELFDMKNDPDEINNLALRTCAKIKV